MASLKLNGQVRQFEAEPDTPPAVRHLETGGQDGRFIWHEVGCELTYESQTTSERKP